MALDDDSMQPILSLTTNEGADEATNGQMIIYHNRV